MKDFNDKAYNTRDDFGNVKVGLKNITTNNMKKGFGSTNSEHLFGTYKYMSSPYDNPHDMERREKMNHKAKILSPFNGSSNPSATFTPHYQTYRLEGEPYQPIKEDTQYRSKTTKKWATNNPNKTGFYGTFSEFPKYIEEGEKIKTQTSHENIWKYITLYIDLTSMEHQKDSRKLKPGHVLSPVKWRLTRLGETKADLDIPS